jgi:hypothetical protein
MENDTDHSEDSTHASSASTARHASTMGPHTKHYQTLSLRSRLSPFPIFPRLPLPSHELYPPPALLHHWNLTIFFPAPPLSRRIPRTTSVAKYEVRDRKNRRVFSLQEATGSSGVNTQYIAVRIRKQGKIYYVLDQII